jgi:hypothetical protein
MPAPEELSNTIMPKDGKRSIGTHTLVTHAHARWNTKRLRCARVCLVCLCVGSARTVPGRGQVRSGGGQLLPGGTRL